MTRPAWNGCVLPRAAGRHKSSTDEARVTTNLGPHHTPLVRLDLNQPRERVPGLDEFVPKIACLRPACPLLCNAPSQGQPCLHSPPAPPSATTRSSPSSVLAAWVRSTRRTILHSVATSPSSSCLNVPKSEELVLRFIQEAKAASALNHPMIVTIHDIGSTIIDAPRGNALHTLHRSGASLLCVDKHDGVANIWSQRSKVARRGKSRTSAKVVRSSGSTSHTKAAISPAHAATSPVTWSRSATSGERRLIGQSGPSVLGPRQCGRSALASRLASRNFVVRTPAGVLEGSRWQPVE